QQHGVQVNVRIEPGQRNGPGDDAATGLPHRPPVGGDQRARRERPAERTRRVPQQERDAEPGDGVDEPVSVGDGCPDTGDTGSDQNDVGHHAHGDHCGGVASRHPLAQHVRVLSSDGDDQGSPGQEPGTERNEHAFHAKARSGTVQQKILQYLKLCFTELVRFHPAQLETLLAIAEDGSFEAAARRLHLTPSAVSQRIRALESAAGQVLVRRTTPAEITDAGAPLLRLARPVRNWGTTTSWSCGWQSTPTHWRRGSGRCCPPSAGSATLHSSSPSRTRGIPTSCFAEAKSSPRSPRSQGRCRDATSNFSARCATGLQHPRNCSPSISTVRPSPGPPCRSSWSTSTTGSRTPSSPPTKRHGPA